MWLRPETPADYPAVYAFIQSAFETAKVSNGQEQDFVNVLRQSPRYLPGFAWLGLEAERLIAFIMLTRLTVKSARPVRGLLLAPLAVELSFRRRGLGAQMVKHALQEAKKHGYEAVCLVGDPAYYSRFGFTRLDSLGAQGSRQFPAAYSLGLELVPGALAGAEIDFLG